MRYTEKRKGKNVIPLRNAVCGVHLPHWSIHEQSEIQSFLSGDAVDRLAELEDKIEQGTLIELPCKVGDTVYWLFTTNIQQEIYECYVTEYIYNKKGLDICLSKKCLNGYAYFTLKDIGNTVFLTREEAEKRLKELQK